MSTTSHDNPMLSVDVVAVRFRDHILQLGLGKRLFEPHLGELALPGVLMRAGERVTDAAQRAVETKLGLPDASINTIVYGQVFDTPTRDERGPTISIGCIAAISAEADGEATWVTFDAVPPLPFDHNQIVAQTREWLRQLIWQQSDPLVALLGDPFPTTAMVALDNQLLGKEQNPANVHRKLSALPFLTPTQGAPVGRGRPQTNWATR